MPLTVLITGFGPFPGAPFNPTGPLAQRLGARRRPVLAEVELITHVFATSYAAVDAELPDLIVLHRPDVLLMFGLAARTPHLRIETRARNAVSALHPDAGGRVRHAAGIRPGQPAALAGRAPFRQLVRAARRARVPARLSRDAGAYLCNYVYWRGIEAQSPNRPVPGPRVPDRRVPDRRVPVVAFVHVPQVGRTPRPCGGARTLNLADLTRAGEAILLALVCAARAASPCCPEFR